MPYKREEKWVAQVKIQGKKVAQKVFLKKKDAKAWEVKTAKEFVEDPIGMQANTVSLLEWANSYLDHAEETFQTKTFEEKRSVFKRFFKYVDPYESVTQLTKSRVMKYLKKRKKESTGNAANKDRKNLVAAWNWGKDYMEPRLPDCNPCETTKMPEVQHPRYTPPEKDFWKVYDAAKGQDQVMLLTFLYTAARRSEIFRLKWDDVDFENKTLGLWTRKRKGGDLEYDQIPLAAELEQSLWWWYENRPLKETPYVFVCLDETAFTREYFGKPFRVRQHFLKRLCEAVKVKPFGFHGIRHLTASILYHKGYELAVLQNVLRHKSATTTNRYLERLGMKNTQNALNEGLRRKSCESVSGLN
jgi:integrase